MKKKRLEAQQHLMADLQVTKASCSCGAQFVLSDALASSLSPSRCQDELLDLYHQHRDVVRETAQDATKNKEI